MAARLYHRELGRVGSTNPVGAALLYDGASRCDLPDTKQCKGLNGGNTKKHWEPLSIVFPLCSPRVPPGTDFTKGVLGLTEGITRPDPSASGDGVLGGNGPSDGNMHGMRAELFFPDRHVAVAELRASSYPPVGNFTQTFAENLLTPGSPRSTFMLQSSAHIGCFASNIGGAAAAYVAWSEPRFAPNKCSTKENIRLVFLVIERRTNQTYFHVGKTLGRSGLGWTTPLQSIRF